MENRTQNKKEEELVINGSNTWGRHFKMIIVVKLRA
jgi:hypothetical protein